MQLNRFDLNLLISLDVLLREKNVTRAAERVHLSQPAMSAALHKMREYFDDPLLIRVGRDMELTPRGLALIEPVREALFHIQAALGTEVQFNQSSAQRAFTIIVSEAAVPGFLPALSRRVAQEAPGVELHIELISQTALARLEYGEADLCLCLDHLGLYNLREYPDTLRVERLRPVRWVCAVDRNHPTVKDTLSVEQYKSLPHAFGRPSGFSISGSELVRRLFDIDLTVHLTVPSLLHLPYVLEGTNYVAAIPERLAQLGPAAGQLKTFPFPFEVPEHHEILLWHKRLEPDPGHAWIRELIISLAHEL